MLGASVVVQVLFMVLAPILLGRALVGLTAAAKQPWFPHTPEAWKLPINAITLGLAAGVCEEPARWIALRRFARNARGWRAAMLFGAATGASKRSCSGCSPP